MSGIDNTNKETIVSTDSYFGKAKTALHNVVETMAGNSVEDANNSGKGDVCKTASKACGGDKATQSKEADMGCTGITSESKEMKTEGESDSKDKARKEAIPMGFKTYHVNPKTMDKSTESIEEKGNDHATKDGARKILSGSVDGANDTIYEEVIIGKKMNDGETIDEEVIDKKMVDKKMTDPKTVDNKMADDKITDVIVVDNKMADQKMDKPMKMTSEKTKEMAEVPKNCDVTAAKLATDGVCKKDAKSSYC